MVFFFWTVGATTIQERLLFKGVLILIQVIQLNFKVKDNKNDDNSVLSEPGFELGTLTWIKKKQSR